MLATSQIDWQKINGLLPVIIQDAATSQVLMLGYMNEAALSQTLQTQWVTFFSRQKQRLWVKGETSGYRLKVISLQLDCDQDSLLILVQPAGPTCHRNTTSCFSQETWPSDFMAQLEHCIEQRLQNPSMNSYTAQLARQGIHRIAQKVGEEGVEVALAAVAEDKSALLNEIADLLFHLLILLHNKQCRFSDVMTVLQQRHR